MELKTNKPKLTEPAQQHHKKSPKLKKKKNYSLLVLLFQGGLSWSVAI
jgi:hypothetical protein